MKYIILLLLLFNYCYASESANDLFHEGLKYAKLKDYNKALYLLGKACKKDPLNKKYLYYSGCAWINSGNNEMGLKTFKKIAELDPNWNSIQKKIYDLLIKTYSSEFTNTLNEKYFFLPKYGMIIYKPANWYITTKYINFGMDPVTVLTQNYINSINFNPFLSIESKYIKIDNSTDSLKKYALNYHNSIKNRFHNYIFRSIKKIKCNSLIGIEIKFFETLQDVKYNYVQYYFYKNNYIFMITLYDKQQNYNYTSVFFNQILNNFDIIPISNGNDQLITNDKYKEYICKQGDFSFYFPKKWKTKVINDPNLITIIHPNKIDINNVNITLGRDFYYKNVSDFWKNYKKNNKIIKFSKSKKLEINGIPAIVAYFDANNKNISYKGIFSIIERNNKIFHLTFICLKKDFEKYSSYFKKIIGSINISSSNF